MATGHKVILLLPLLMTAPAVSDASSLLADFTIYTEDHPPVNYEEDGEARGISVDLLLDMFRRLGIDKSRKDITLVPWTRGYVEIQRRPNILLFSMDRTPARDHLFEWVGPIMKSHMVLLAKKEKTIRIVGPGDFNAYIFGTIRHDVSEQILLATGVSSKNVYHLNSPQLVAQMLARDRIDLWPYERLVGFWILQQEGYDPNAFEPVWNLAESHYHFAFSKGTEDALISGMQAALDAARADGTLRRLVEAYIPGGAAALLNGDISTHPEP